MTATTSPARAPAAFRAAAIARARGQVAIGQHGAGLLERRVIGTFRSAGEDRLGNRGQRRRFQQQLRIGQDLSRPSSFETQVRDRVAGTRHALPQDGL